MAGVRGRTPGGAFHGAGKMNDKGLMFEGYRMLIGAIVALLILTIIVGAINYLSQLEFDISMQRFFSGLESAVKQPNGDILYIDGARFEKGAAFSRSSLAGRMGIAGECVEFDTPDSPFRLTEYAVHVEENAKTDVYIRCETDFSGSCPVGCIISFGRELEPKSAGN